MTVIEVYAEVACPFAHVGLRQFVDRRHELGRDDVVLHVRSWPLELVNGEPLDAHHIAEEVDDIRRQVDEPPFAAFREAAFPSSSLPAMALAAAAYELDLVTGERVSLELRDLLFEQGVDVADQRVLEELARRNGLDVDLADTSTVVAEHRDGVARGVIGSPHFFTPSGSFFCPSLDIAKDDAGHLRVTQDPEFAAFLEACLSG